MEKKDFNTEFIIDAALYANLSEKKNYRLPAHPVAMIKANATADQKQRFKKLFFNKAGIYGWLHVQQSVCYIGSATRLHVRPWQHVTPNGSTNKNLKHLFSTESLENFVLIIFEILGSSEEITASLLEKTENNYLQKYIPRKLLLNVLFFAYTNMGYKHTEEIKKKFSLDRKGKPGKKRPEITGTLHPIYGRTQEQNPFFGKKHTAESLQKIREAAKKRSIHGCPVKLQNVHTNQMHVFATKKEAAKFLGYALTTTLTKHIKEIRLIKDIWSCVVLTKEEYKNCSLHKDC